MQRWDLCLLGFGSVNQGLARLLLERSDDLKRRHGVSFRITGVASRRHGGAHAPRGFDLAALLQAAATASPPPLPRGGRSGLTPLQLIDACRPHVVVEATPTDLATARPALDHVEAAFRLGCHVVTANKGPVALHRHRLDALARRCGVAWRYEGAVMSGTPVLSLCREAMAGAHVTGFRGILNGTTNYILTELLAGEAFDAVLARAQRLGYAEADPSGDVDGHDAAAKVLILGSTLLGASATLAEVERRGIRSVTAAKVAEAAARGLRWRLVGEGRRKPDGSVSLSVAPRKVPADSFLGGVTGARNALEVDTDVLGTVAITGPGAGGPETGFALLSDLLALTRAAAPAPARER